MYKSINITTKPELETSGRHKGKDTVEPEPKIKLFQLRSTAWSKSTKENCPVSCHYLNITKYLSIMGLCSP